MLKASKNANEMSTRTKTKREGKDGKGKEQIFGRCKTWDEVDL
jgi:hypothetical protein